MSRLKLLDAYAMAKANPLTFELPAKAQLQALVPGDFVKAGFATPHTQVSYERMWVKVTHADPTTGAIRGTLANNPAFTDAIHYGDVVKLEYRNVLDVTVQEQASFAKSEKTNIGFKKGGHK